MRVGGLAHLLRFSSVGITAIGSEWLWV